MANYYSFQTKSTNIEPVRRFYVCHALLPIWHHTYMDGTRMITTKCKFSDDGTRIDVISEINGLLLASLKPDLNGTAIATVINNYSKTVESLVTEIERLTTALENK